MSHRGKKALPPPKCTTKGCKRRSAWGDWFCTQCRDEATLELRKQHEHS